MGKKHELHYPMGYAPRHITGRHGPPDTWTPRPHLRPNARPVKPATGSLLERVREMLRRVMTKARTNA